MIGEYARRTTAVFTVVVLAALSVLIFIDVIGRYIFSSPLPGSIELVEGFMAVVMLGSLTQATYSREHIRLEFIMIKASHGWRTVLEKLSQFAVLLVTAGIGWGLFERTLSLRDSGDLTPVLHLPIYLMAGFAFLIAVAAIMVAARLLFSPDSSDLPSGEPNHD
ncbi:TRAP-type C4-dicarboxylate transport system, small permease component [Amphritea atlantica]|uniref:TRAP transporter small permease protein n=1 Tax=Amphritea atlantica TaxID=355243 RepID=A0A1H9J092_9GAMM|nr:TRAP transporter small permease subunit [Amphritea atlantica]SEQ80471.1 TRAP-type C4-dicarboxylate transport system, small permease component [Amphritea atlantica]